MRFFSELSNKLFWLILGIVFLSLGYFFVVRNLLNPPRIANVPTSNSSPNSTPQSKSNTSLSESKETNFSENDPLKWQPELKETSSSNEQIIQANKEIIPIPKNLKRGVFLSIYHNEIEEINPEPHLYQPKFVIDAPNLVFASWYPKYNEFQEVQGFFYVPENSSYDFFVRRTEAIDNYLNQNPNARILSLSINGFKFLSHKGGTINLEKGWHHVSLFFNPPLGYQNPRALGASLISVWWSKGNQKQYKPLRVYREVKEKVTQDFQDEKTTETDDKVSVKQFK